MILLQLTIMSFWQRGNSSNTQADNVPQESEKERLISKALWSIEQMKLKYEPDRKKGEPSSLPWMNHLENIRKALLGEKVDKTALEEARITLPLEIETLRQELFGEKSTLQIEATDWDDTEEIWKIITLVQRELHKNI